MVYYLKKLNNTMYYIENIEFTTAKRKYIINYIYGVLLLS